MDEVTAFYVDVLNELVATGTISKTDSVLVVCGGPTDASALSIAGFNEVTVTNLDDGMSNQKQDAENLSYDDGAFDLVIVHAGLHHCQSPHRALLEMFRVARKCALAFEARDSLLMRTAIRLGLTVDYELEAVSSSGFEAGGLRNGPIPNFIYRWTERGVRDTISSYDPAHVQDFKFFYRLRLPLLRFSKTNRPIIRAIGSVAAMFGALFTRLAPRQCNEFAFAVIKTGKLKPWMETDARLSRDYAIANKRMYG